MRARPTEVPKPGRLDWQILRSLLPWLWEYRFRSGIALLLLVAAKVATVTVPLILREVVDGLDPQVTTTIVLPLALLIGYGALRFASAMFRELQSTVFAWVRQGIMRRMSRRVVSHLHSLSLRFHLARKTGAVARDIGRGTNSVSTLLNYLLFNIVPTFIEVGLVAAILITQYDARFASVCVGAFAAYLVFTFVVTRWRMKYRIEMNQLDSKASSEAIDGLLNYETVKYFGNEDFEVGRYDASLADQETAAIKSQASLSLLNAGQGLIIAVGVTWTMVLAAQGVVDRTMSIGDLVAVNAYLLQIFIPLGFLGTVYSILKHSLADMERMFDLLDEPAEIVDARGAKDLDPGRGDIVFDGVSFAYDPNRPILKNISFDVPAGAQVALVGPSGSGKSTIARLLYRFYDVQEGAIRVAGDDVRDVTWASLRDAIGIVPQDTVLFNDTIRYNLQYARLDASHDELVEAARMANILSFIEALPDGWDTVVGERGLKLSGGEKQRVAIARAILKRPRFLIFDEATSSLDSRSEQAILGAMRDVARGHTTLVIAHRLSTIVESDMILVLEAGELVERGTHDELLAKDGLYASMWWLQQDTRDAETDESDAPE